MAAAFVSGFVAPASAVPVTVIDGRGWGHGVGMSQDGAYWLAQAGQSHIQILAHFYPGTKLATRGGAVRVPVFSGGFSFLLPQGGVVDGQEVPAGFTGTARAGAASTAPALTNGPAATAAEGATVGLGSVQLIAAIHTQASEGAVRVQASDGAGPGGAVVAATAPTTSTVATQVAVAVSGPAPVVGSGPVAGSGEAPVADPRVEPPVEPPTSVAEPVTIVGTIAPGAALAGGLTPSPPPAGQIGEPGSAGEPATSRPSVSDLAVPPGATVRIRAAGGGVVGAGGKRFRGTLEITNQGGLRVVNELDMEDYLRGMGEIGRGLGYPPAALRAQAVAARTYAFRTMATQGQICASDRCQVYLGAQAEYPAMDDAVAATRGQVLTYGGKLAAAFFSASGGGESATVEEGFGGANLAYLVATPYLTGDLREWSLSAPAAEFGRRLGYPGTATAVEVSRAGPSGRPLEITISGSVGARRLGGLAVKKALRLRSTLWTIRTEESAVAPSLPADGGGAPDDAQAALLVEPSDTVVVDSPSTPGPSSTFVPTTAVASAPTVLAPTSSTVDPFAAAPRPSSVSAASLPSARASAGGPTPDWLLWGSSLLGFGLVGFALWRWFRGVEHQ